MACRDCGSYLEAPLHVHPEERPRENNIERARHYHLVARENFTKCARFLAYFSLVKKQTSNKGVFGVKAVEFWNLFDKHACVPPESEAGLEARKAPCSVVR